MFQQYQNGIAPVQGQLEAGANIGRMYGNALANVGENLAKGIEEYHKNRDMVQAADQKIDVMSDAFAERINLFSSSPELAPFAARYEPLHAKLQKAHGLGLSQKIALLHEVDTLNEKTDKDFNIYNVVKQSQAMQMLPEGIAAANQGSVISAPRASNPEDTKWSPYKTYDQNEQSVRKYYRDIVSKSPSAIKFKTENDFINQWRRALPSVIAADSTLHPSVKANAIQQIEQASADVEYGPEAQNLHTYLSRYSDTPVPPARLPVTSSGFPAPVTTATPSAVPAAPVALPSPASVYPTAAAPASAPASLPTPVAMAPVAPTAPAPVLPLPASLPPAAGTAKELEERWRAGGSAVALPTPAAVATPPTSAFTPVIPPPVAVAPRAVAPQVVPPVPVQQPVAPAAVTPALPPPASKSKPSEPKKVEPKFIRKEGAVPNGQSAKWYAGKGDSVVAFAQRNGFGQLNVYDILEINGLPLNASDKQIDTAAEKNGGELLLPIKRTNTGKLDFENGPTGDMGTEGDVGIEGQTTEAQPDVSVPLSQNQLDLGRKIWSKQGSALSTEYMGATSAREYTQSLLNNVERGTGSGLPTGIFDQTAKENPDLWRPLSFGANLSLKVFGAARFGQGVSKLLSASKEFAAMPEATKESIVDAVKDEVLKETAKIKGGENLTPSDPRFLKIWNKALQNVSAQGRAPYLKGLTGAGMASQGAGLGLASTLFSDKLDNKWDFPSNISKGGPAWDSAVGGKFVVQMLDDIRNKFGTQEEIQADPIKLAQVSAFLRQKEAEAKENEKKAKEAKSSHWSKAGPAADIASYRGAQLPEKERAQALNLGGPVDRFNLITEEQPDVSMPAMTMGVQEIVRPPSIDEKRQSLMNFYQKRLGYVPSSFEAMFKQSYPEASLSFQETPYGVMMHDGKDWKPLSSGKTLQNHEIASNKAVTFGSLKSDGSFIGEELVPNSGIRVSGIGAFGSPSDATKFRQEFPKLIKAKRAILKLQEINSKFGKSLMLTERGRASILTKELITQLRTDIVGVGTVSNFEQEILTGIIQNPSEFFHWSDTTAAKYETLLEQINDSIKTTPNQYGLSVETKQEEVDKLNAARQYFRQLNK
jgi:hypothetical protein